MKKKIETALALREPEVDAGLSLVQYPPVPLNPVEEPTPLRDYWKAVRKRLWLVIGLALITCLITTIVMLRKDNLYQAVARVQVDLETTSPPLGGSKISSVLVSSQINDPAYFNTQLQILAGPGLLRRAVKTLDLEHNADFIEKVNHRPFWKSLERLAGLGGSKLPQTSDPANVPVTASSGREELAEAERLAPFVDSLQRDLEVEPVKEMRLPIKETRLIEIRYTSVDPRLAANIVNAVADDFAAANLEKKTKTGSASSDFLNKRIAELQSQIRSGEEKLIAYGRSKQILSLEPTQNTVVDRLTGLNKQLLEAENDRKLAEAAYGASRQPGAATALVLANSKNIDDAEQKLTDLQQRRAQLLVDATEEWPDVKEVDQQISTLQRKIEDMKSRAKSVVITNLKTRYQQALTREKSLRTSFTQQRAETLTQNEAAVNYYIIKQEIETNKNLLDGLLQRAKENDVTVAGTPNNINVVDYGIAPRLPVGPHRLAAVGLASLVAILFGVCLAIFLEYLDNTVRSTDDVEQMLHLPALAVIPSYKSGTIVRRFMPSGKNNGENGNALSRPELLIDLESHSQMAEAYKQLRTAILLSSAGRPPRTLLVTSASPGEGKTTTTANTAISLAQTGARVLVIDADMRNPRIHSVFNLSNEVGLSNALSREANEKEILSMINSLEEGHPRVMTCGPIPPNPAELLGSKTMKVLLQKLGPHFDHIVIDSPPVTNVTDGVLLASLVDGVILVVQGGRSTREVVRRGRQLLQNIGARVFGVVLNNVKTIDHQYYYLGYYARKDGGDNSGTAKPIPVVN